MDIPDDADGRVAIFTADVLPEEPMAGMPGSHAGPLHTVVDRLGSWLDGPYAGVAIAVVLALVLVLGLLLLRR